MADISASDTRRYMPMPAKSLAENIMKRRERKGAENAKILEQVFFAFSAPLRSLR